MNATVITGASRGIGREVALKLAEQGPVLLVATVASEGKLKELCGEITSRGAKADYVVGDVGDLTTAKRVAEKAEQLGWTVQNLVLNAGVSKSGPATGTPATIVSDIFQTNFFGVLYFVKEFVPGMTSRGAGSVVVMAGAAAIKGYRSMGAYCASKHAVLGYLRSLAQEVSSKGVKVTPIVPGPVDTDMTAPIVEMFVKKGMSAEDAKAKIAAANNMKAILTPRFISERVAEIVSGALPGPGGEPVGELWGAL